MPNYSFAPVIGLDCSFGHFVAGIEFMFNLGSYSQDVNDGIGLTEQKVFITRPEVAISGRYKF